MEVQVTIAQNRPKEVRIIGDAAVAFTTELTL
jgi:hypothetical protein